MFQRRKSDDVACYKGERLMLSSYTRSGPAARFLGIFALTVVLPGTLLAFAGGRALVQERRAVEREVDERLKQTADRAARAVDRELSLWRSSVARFFTSSARDASSLPSTFRDAAAEPGGAVLVAVESSRVAAWPDGQLLYALDDRVPGPQPARSAAFLTAEQSELRDGRLSEAARMYRDLLPTAVVADRPVIRQRLARTLRKSGHLAEAARLYESLAQETGAISDVPAELIGRYELCSIHAERGALERQQSCAEALYRDLVGGRWSISRPLYSHYSESARNWLAGSQVPSTTLAALRGTEQLKASLTALVERSIASDGSALTTTAEHVLLNWQDRSSSRGRYLVVVARRELDRHVWPQVLAGEIDSDALADVRVADGGVLYAPASDSGQAPPSVEAQAGTDLPFRLTARAWLRDPASRSADVARRQTFYLALLGAAVLVMAVGGYFTMRVVRQELAVAQLKADFVSAVSHEFRSPLTGLRQLGELLARGRVADDRRQVYYERITHESDRLARLVENLLDFSRMQSGKREYRMAPLDVGVWLRSLVAEFSGRQSSPTPEVRLNVVSPLPTVSADAEALATAVENLLDNAIKYSPGKAAIWVDTEATREALHIRVRDEGVGISADDQRRMFDAFHRGTSEHTRGVTGVGIGLSLVRHIVSAHGGRVQCESELGHGTVFTITLPV